MMIKDLFVKPIDRDIKGVIKVGQDDSSNVRQELEEYVVTRELQKHFAEFFSSYKRGILGTTDKMGVWISGFFGSGKSHFLKILSYLLDNREVDGKAAIDYFIDDKKIIDNAVLADMRLAANVPTDVVLFNIDSKGETSGKQSKDAIVSVFLKVFNEMQGFCGSIPFLADLERKLTDNGKYDEFKTRFEDSFGSPWKEARNDFDFIQDDVVEVLSDMGFMSEEAARNWCEKAAEPYSISIERFAELVKKYIDKKGNNHHVVFLVDEIGQYIGDDSKLMLNLQTVTEDLGTACRGKAWIIVTSQQDIDSITKVKGNDFSKIQGRFDTRLSLSSANVDEVIRKRILEKNALGKETLALLYDEKATIIRNLIDFKECAEKKFYSGREDFAAVYPFIPYQFNLLGSVLTSIRTHGASGKHLAEGERSMLALFKESAVRIMNQETGALVPFNIHCYLPGWEIPKFRPNSFTNDYGFITDYLSEFLRELRKESFGDALDKYFKLGSNLNQRDTIAVRKMVSGMLKLLYPDGDFGKVEVREVLTFALEMRRRVKEQLKKIGGMEFYDVNFSFVDNDSFEETFVSVPEQGGGKLIPDGMCNPGHIYTVSRGKSGMIGVYRLETQMLPGNGKLERTGLGTDREARESTNTAFNYLKANANAISGNISTTSKDYIINYQDLNGIGITKHLALPTVIAICSVALSRPTVTGLAVLGDISISGTIMKVEDLANVLQVCLDSGAKKVLLPITSAADIGSVPSELVGAFSLIFYSTPQEAVFKALGVD